MDIITLLLIITGGIAVGLTVALVRMKRAVAQEVNKAREFQVKTKNTDKLIKNTRRVLDQYTKQYVKDFNIETGDITKLELNKIEQILFQNPSKPVWEAKKKELFEAKKKRDQLDKKLDRAMHIVTIAFSEYCAVYGLEFDKNKNTLEDIEAFFDGK